MMAIRFASPNKARWVPMAGGFLQRTKARNPPHKAPEAAATKPAELGLFLDLDQSRKRTSIHVFLPWAPGSQSLSPA